MRGDTAHDGRRGAGRNSQTLGRVARLGEAHATTACFQGLCSFSWLVGWWGLVTPSRTVNPVERGNLSGY